MSHLKGIAFESDEVQLAKLRERLRKMMDDELIKFGKMVRALGAPRVGVTPDPWKAQLKRRVLNGDGGTLSCQYNENMTKLTSQQILSKNPDF